MEYIEELEDIKNQNPYIEEGQTTQWSKDKRTNKNGYTENLSDANPTKAGGEPVATMTWSTTIWSFPHSCRIIGIVTRRLARRVPLAEHLSSPPALVGFASLKFSVYPFLSFGLVASLLKQHSIKEIIVGTTSSGIYSIYAAEI
jgi:hypothetical protein